MPSTPAASRNNSGAGAGTQDASAKHVWEIARQPGSAITFASFDPGTATGDHHVHAFRRLSLNEELCRPKRVVIETLPDGKCTWRFVPKARWEEGVENEGSWPRLADVCGEKITISQDEWDMYKLDQHYECLVRKPPALSTVKIRSGQASVDSSDDASNSVEHPTDALNGKLKRRLSENSPSISRRPSGGSSDEQKRKLRKRVDIFSSSEEDENEVSEMVIDNGSGSQGKAHLQSERLRKVRENIEDARRKRREWNARWREKNGFLGIPDEDEDMMSWSESRPSPKKSPLRAQTAELPTFKRKTTIDSDDSSDDSVDDERTPGPRFKSYAPNGKQKRTRTMSPGATLRELQHKRAARGRKRREEKALRAQKRAEAKQAALLAELMAEHSHSQPSNGEPSNGTSASSSSSSDPHTPEQTMSDSDEAARLARLEESKRKIAELEKDRPLWEEQARKRAAQEAEGGRRAEEEKKSRACREADDAAEEREKQRAKELAEENARREREAAAAQLRIKRMRARDNARCDAQTWMSRGWNTAIALERYKHLSEAFDKANFFKGDVVVFECIPWPVLHKPLHFGVEDIDWSAVETFFKQVRRHLSSTEYRTLLEKSHKRFHPDRWRSRRVLQCIEDEEEKECLEVAANTVAQALTPLWQELTGRS